MEKSDTVTGRERSFDTVHKEVVNLCNKSYWKRVWIVQEIGNERMRMEER